MTAMDVAPTHDDPLLAQNSELIGGPSGTLSTRRSRWWSPLRVLVVLTALGYSVGLWLDSSCRGTQWASPERYEHLCYTDIHPFYSLKGLADGVLPYVGHASPEQMIDAPVLVGLFMQVSAMVTSVLHGLWSQLDRAVLFTDVTTVLLFIPLVITVIATSLAVRNRPWDAAMIALAPMVILAATINWDLLAVSLVALSYLALQRSRPIVCGVLLGAALCAAHYPIAIVIAALILAMRTRTWQLTMRVLVAAALTWLVVNLPIMIISYDGWSVVYRRVVDGGAELGSAWYALTQVGGPTLSTPALNVLSLLAFATLCVGIAVVVHRASQAPRLASVVFLVVAAFALTAKGFAPQYGLWLIPLAVLARPRWRDFLIWQACEVAYFAAVWWFLAGYQIEGAKGLTPQWYAVATLVHIAGTVYFAAMVIRDIREPDQDPVRLTSQVPAPHRTSTS